MNRMKKGRRIALLAGMIIVATIGFTVTTIYAHGHRGGGGAHHAGGGGGVHAGGGMGGDIHHRAYPHKHHGAGEHPGSEGTGYYHSHDDHGEHHHECRPTSSTVWQSSSVSDSDEECQNHDGKWEPTQRD